MGASKTLQTLAEAGFSVALDDGRIVVWPAERLTDRLRDAIRGNRSELVALLMSVGAEVDALIARLRVSAPNKWTDADVTETRHNACRDYPAGLNCLRALTGSKQ